MVTGLRVDYIFTILFQQFVILLPKCDIKFKIIGMIYVIKHNSLRYIHPEIQGELPKIIIFFPFASYSNKVDPLK